VRATVTRTLDGLVLGTTERKAEPGAAARAALLQQVRATRLAALPWTRGARSLQQRVMFLGRTFGDAWPDLSDPALLATLDDWLAPALEGVSDLASVDLVRVLRGRLPHPRQAELDTLAPASVAVGARQVRVDYGTERPTVAARIQDLFGTTRHPTIAGGRVPLVVQLLSPAGRPVQVTADLPGFWAGSYAAVRKEMAGRYPKHPWPANPAVPANKVAGHDRHRDPG
jgi:ATP-dependent RNA helicase HrpB